MSNIELNGDHTTPGTVRFTRTLPAPIERVWAYVTESDKRATWLAGGEMELRVGGKVHLHFLHKNLSPNEEPPEDFRDVHYEGADKEGVVTQCDPPHLLAFTWNETSEVSFHLTPVADGTRLELIHRKLDPTTNLYVSSGWQLHLDILSARLEGIEPLPFWENFLKLKEGYSEKLGVKD